MTPKQCGMLWGVWAATGAVIAVSALLGAWGGYYMMNRKLWR